VLRGILRGRRNRKKKKKKPNALIVSASPWPYVGVLEVAKPGHGGEIFWRVAAVERVGVRCRGQLAKMKCRPRHGIPAGITGQVCVGRRRASGSTRAVDYKPLQYRLRPVQGARYAARLSDSSILTTRRLAPRHGPGRGSRFRPASCFWPFRPLSSVTTFGRLRQPCLPLNNSRQLKTHVGKLGTAWSGTFNTLATATCTTRRGPSELGERWLASGDIEEPVATSSRASTIHAAPDPPLVRPFSGRAPSRQAAGASLTKRCEPLPRVVRPIICACIAPKSRKHLLVRAEAGFQSMV